MIEGLTQGRDIYYRGYQIHQDIQSICYTIYGPRPLRPELTVVGRSQEAMRWIDRRIEEENRQETLSGTQPPLWRLLGPTRFPVEFRSVAATGPTGTNLRFAPLAAPRMTKVVEAGEINTGQLTSINIVVQ